MFQKLQEFMKPLRGLDVDFQAPKGAEALVPRDGISWEVFSNPISLYIGGIAAVILELTESSVGLGVWDYSNFKQDTFGRLHRTAYAAMITVFAPKQDAERMIARVVKMHDQVRGINFEGEAYFANDKRLLNWVQATATYGFTEAYHYYVRPLSKAEKDRAFIEAQASGTLYGADAVPKSWTEWEALLEQTIPTLKSHDILTDFIDVMQTADIFPPALKWFQRLLVKASVEMSPPQIQAFPQLQGLRMSKKEKWLMKKIAKTTNYLPLKELPPYQSRQRMA